jgi:tetratricopeptide (TPR) repeat protein
MAVRRARAQSAARLVLPLAVFIATGAIFWYHAAPGVCFHDSGEFSLAAMSWGLTHPPGAPTYTLLAAPFVWLGHFANAARGANLFSALMGAVTMALLFVFSRMALRTLAGDLSAGAINLCALVAPVILMNSEAFLEQSFFAEQYTLLTALMMAFFVALAKIDALARDRAGGRQPRWICMMLGFIFGVAIGNHPSQLCLALPALLAFAFHAKRYGKSYAWAEVRMSILGLALGLLVFVWLPVSGFRQSTMDPIRATTWSRFWWAITRQAYPKRGWSEVPDHFAQELLYTYDFIGELSIFGFPLAIIGVLFMVRRRSLPVLCATIGVLAYAAGMFQGFCLQRGQNLQNIWFYGVRDWHLPLYLLGSVFGAIGALGCTRWLSPKLTALSGRGYVVPVAFLLIAATTAAIQVPKISLRNFDAPQQYIDDLMSSMPADSILLANYDNPAMLLGYYTCRTGKQVEAQRVLYTYQVDPAKPPHNLQTVNDWTTESRVRFIRAVEDPARQPLLAPRLSDERVLNGPLFTDYYEEGRPMHHFMVPHGYLFRIQDHLSTTSEVLQAEAEWKQNHPEGFRRPDPGKAINHLEAEARGTLHWERATFLHGFDLYAEALADYRLSLQWLPNNARTWFGLGQCLQSLGAPPGEALRAYAEALHWEPWLEHVRVNMAVLQAGHGDFDKAIQLLQDELALDPGDPVAQKSLQKYKAAKAARQQGH